ncbi:OmpH family outer membrane protein [Novosphingobium mangrovi (ex Huang et al. 2023)]|uniref:OmpH family outer membrane protein n=1 Tax=Novosphingobium mangrovi (ex Huang et al. 2023) TaxID=2976432 RepID=A0ABT2I702_9SPHN|nr:OmpH family outer membrane protein [Novosphingobium mangrovi (ex Huang et al. 2023)]MCT2400581.1 OmpH family outer membrane protein [Novosphingobium mangrovi (ex Huang et al. 2023)]
MKTITKSVALGSALALATLSAQPALAAKAAPAAPSDSGTIVPGLGIANLDAVVVNSNAYKVAEQQRETTYKAQYDQAKTRNDQLTAQIKPMVDKFNTDRQAANPNQASLQQQAAAIQQLQEQGKAELQQILQPVALSQAYVQEQIEDKLNDALKSAMKKRSISIVLAPDSVIAFNGNAYNLNQDILNELNTAIPSAQLVPPAGWEPRRVREARAQQAAAQGQAAAATSQQPTGR